MTEYSGVFNLAPYSEDVTDSFQAITDALKTRYTLDLYVDGGTDLYWTASQDSNLYYDREWTGTEWVVKQLPVKTVDTLWWLKGWQDFVGNVSNTDKNNTVYAQNPENIVWKNRTISNTLPTYDSNFVSFKINTGIDLNTEAYLLGDTGYYWPAFSKDNTLYQSDADKQYLDIYYSASLSEAQREENLRTMLGGFNSFFVSESSLYDAYATEIVLDKLPPNKQITLSFDGFHYEGYRNGTYNTNGGYNLDSITPTIIEANGVLLGCVCSVVRSQTPEGSSEEYYSYSRSIGSIESNGFSNEGSVTTDSQGRVTIKIVNPFTTLSDSDIIRTLADTSETFQDVTWGSVKNSTYVNTPTINSISYSFNYEEGEGSWSPTPPTESDNGVEDPYEGVAYRYFYSFKE